MYIYIYTHTYAIYLQPHNINKYINFSDNIATVLLKSWDMDSTLFDGELLAGPVPTLFSDNIETSSNNVMADPLKFHWDMAKICKCFLMHETISVEEALAYAKKPR